MQSNSLKANPGARKALKRVARGGSRGAQAGRGHKGQSSRSGGTKGPGFEGGQTPWYRRLPHYRGFKNPFRTVYQEVKLSHLDGFEDGATINPESLLEKKILRNLNK